MSQHGAQALWGQETMAGMADGGPAAGGRLEAELGYGMPVGGRLVGTPRFGIGAPGHGRVRLFQEDAQAIDCGKGRAVAQTKMAHSP